MTEASPQQQLDRMITGYWISQAICRANVIHIEINEDGVATIWAELEQDHE